MMSVNITVKARDFVEEYPVKFFFHKNSKIVDLATSILIGFGIGLILNCKKRVIKGISFKASYSVILGIFCLVFGFAGKQILKDVVSASLNRYQYAFQPFTQKNISLSYQGSLPILHIKKQNPPDVYNEGFFQGYYFEKQISALREKRFIPKVENKHHSHLQEYKRNIPENYLNEMQGIVNGYNLRIKQKSKFSFGNKLTLDELILFHLLPELEQLNLDQTPTDFNTLACTVILTKDLNGNPLMGRNLDWNTKGVMGCCSLLIRRESKEGTTLSLTLPGLVGVPTGMNDRGLCLAMNVCKGTITSNEGMPSLLFNRDCLEKKSIQEVKELTKLRRPSGAYHLSMADVNSATVVHFYQDNGQDYWRELKADPLVTTNYRYNSDGKTEPTSKDSEIRELAVIRSLEKNMQKDAQKKIKKALSLPRVNNIKTAHQVFMFPCSKSLEIKIDNGWAANAKSVTINMD